MKFPKLISLLVLVTSFFSSDAQVSIWPLGHGQVNDYAYAIGSNNTGDLYFVKSILDDQNGFYIDKIMHTKLDQSGNWTDPIMLPPPVNDNFNNAVVGISPNADTLYLLGNYRAAHPRLRPGLSYATKKSQEEWKIEGVIELEGLKPTTEFYGIYVSTSNNILLASFQNKKSGKDDLFIARQLDNKPTYSALIPLPDYINTNDSEISPFISEDGKTLTFSRWVGDDKTGSYQIYSCRSRSEDFMSWTQPTPVNVANSNSFDAYYWCCLQDYAFFSSDRDSVGKSSIYTFQIIEKQDLEKTGGINLASIDKSQQTEGIANADRITTMLNPLSKLKTAEVPTDETSLAHSYSLEGRITGSKNSAAHLHMVDAKGSILETIIEEKDGSFKFEAFTMSQFDHFELDNEDAEDDSQVFLIDENGVESEAFAFSELNNKASQFMINKSEIASNEPEIAVLETEAASSVANDDKLNATSKPLSPISAEEVPTNETSIAHSYSLEGRITGSKNSAAHLHMVDAKGSILETIIEEKDGSFKFEAFTMSQFDHFELDNEDAEDDSQVFLIDENGVESEAFAFSELNNKASQFMINKSETASNEPEIAMLKTEAATTVEKIKTADERLAETSSSNTGIAVFFDKNQTEPTAKSMYQIESLKSAAALVEQIKASTDTYGSESYNLGLSTKRAKVISDYLTFSGPTKSEGEIENMSATLARSGNIILNESSIANASGTLFNVIVYHPFDQKTVEYTSEINIAYTAYLLKGNSKLKVRVNSFTDNLGNSEYNNTLSQKRADFVRTKLLEFGVNADQLESAWFGSTKSINDCQARDCNIEERALDRRTELQLIMP